ncbi:protein Churchill isoform X2 [Oratosquilla oratoria]|uniref:protein Churchill isoform X2 n=1 Tax=Oratosquilla oratoria TaxID=337810 RepID=UPI003F77362F
MQLWEAAATQNVNVTMCKDCVKEEFPDRGSICLDSGAYLANLNGCKLCGRKDRVQVVNKATTQEGDQEVTTFQHKCEGCEHLIATHEYCFWVEEDFQYYEMSCLLCGESDDTRSCLPDDPRMAATLF